MRPGQIQPNELEVAFLNTVEEEYPDLRAQWDALHVLSREYTGVGSYTTFEGGEKKSDKFRLLPLNSQVQLPNGDILGAIIYWNDTSPAMLEIHSYNGLWDGLFEGFAVVGTKQLNEPKRD